MTFLPDSAVPPGRLAVGVVLPSPAVQRAQKLGLADAARHAEQAGLDLVSHGDRPAGGAASPDAAVALATAAGATGRVTVVGGVGVPALRPLALAARRIASLQHVADGRLVLGVEPGGGREQWAAAGVPYEERGRRTDSALRLLPRLLAGEPVPLPYEASGAEAGPVPAVPVPPVWIGGNSPTAIRRAARLGDGWFPSLAPSAEVAEGAVRLAELAVVHGRKLPVVAVGTTGVLGTEPGLPGRADIAARLAAAHGSPAGRFVDVPVTGGLQEAAERLHSYCGAGVSRILMRFAGGDWRHQVDLLADVRTLLR
ncbi:LLM class flavin-dependent oxidoreductase [Streptomyces sp. NPDC017529]|uniref:LLM class flavin-dependent oxidoreductase n=1 Tax=Streptomyces sp. NPDC017529 TaxID=3365000 RepID=UPI00379A807F